MRPRGNAFSTAPFWMLPLPPMSLDAASTKGGSWLSLGRTLGGISSPVCEMCGAERPRLKNVNVEGTQLMLCERCARFGVEVKRPETRRVTKPAQPRKIITPSLGESEYDLALDFPERIRKARESSGWKREDLAKRINEKLSVIEKLEKGKMRPSDQLVAKLEKALKVKLRERIEGTETRKKEERRPLTLGDLIRRQE